MADDAWKQHVRELLGQLTNAWVRDDASYEFGRQRDTRCLSVVVPKTEAKTLYRQVRERLPPGLVCYIGTSRWFTDDRPSGMEVVVGPGDTQFDIVRLAHTEAGNYDLDNDAIIATLEQFDREFGIDISRAEADTVAFEFRTLPDDVGSLAERIYQFCPDTVDQGFESVDALAEAVAASKSCLLWWD